MADAIRDLAGATRLARAVTSEILIYHSKTIEQSLRDGRPFAGLEDELIEARSLFVRRVAAPLEPTPLLLRTLQAFFGDWATKMGLPGEGLAQALAAALERGERLALRIVGGGQELGRIIPLGDGVQVLGRTAPADLEIADPSIADRHARFVVDGARVSVEEVESTGGGIFIDDHRVRSAVLDLGARFKLGGVLLMLIHVAAVEAALESPPSVRADLGRTIDRKAIIDALRAALGRGGPLALVLCDLDEAHTAGDELPRSIAARITAAVQAQQGLVIGRHDGAFVVLLPGKDALEHAERLRSAVTREPVPTRGGPILASLSIGVTADLEQSVAGPEVWLKDAQAAIASARRSGRIGVVSAS